jgi:SAM-dependent methyltransferase
MSREDDAATKTADRKPSSIPAPATVPRPSRPPGATSTPPPGMTARPLSAPPALGSNPDGVPTQRKGTLSGVPPPPAAPTYPGYNEEDFDAERTMVVDPDDAPTADYDPRVASPYASAGLGQARVADAVPQPRASEIGRRRTSRRTVKIPEDPVRRKERPSSVTVEEAPEAALDGVSTKTPEATPVPSFESTPDTPMDAMPDSMPDMRDFSEEITVVKPLRIIDVGNDPPPPIRSAFATWPPAPHVLNDSQGLGEARARDFAEPPIEAGWTPAAPSVIEIGARTQDIAPPRQQHETEPAPPGDEEPPTPVAPPVVFREEAPAMRPPMTSAPDIVVEPAGVEGGVERDEILEEIEPDAAPIAPKRPPPPPRKAEVKVEPVPEREPQRPKAWFEDIFSDEYIRTHDRPDSSLVRREVDFIEESLAVEKHAVVLDLACGMGDHANELAARGYSVVGLDLSNGMLDIAKRGAKRRLAADPGFAPPTFTHGDMRDMSYEEAFDGVYCWSTSFGYFEEEKNLAVLSKVHRALRQGGMFLLDVINRDYVAPRSPSLVWFEGTQCVCMDDMFVDFFSSRLRVKRTAMFEGGLSRELDYSIRLYSLNELGKMLKEVGFKVVEVTGHTAHPGVFFGTESPRMIVLAERT